MTTIAFYSSWPNLSLVEMAMIVGGLALLGLMIYGASWIIGRGFFKGAKSAAEQARKSSEASGEHH